VLLGLSVCTACVYALIASAGLKLLLPLAMLAGLVFGGNWALMPSCTSELFGSTHFAANQSLIHLATAVGGFLFHSSYSQPHFLADRLILVFRSKGSSIRARW